MGAMRPSRVVKLPPLLDEHLGFLVAAEPLAIQQFVAELAIEAFDEAVLPRAAGCDEGRANRLVEQSAHDPSGGNSASLSDRMSAGLPYNRINLDSISITSCERKLVPTSIATDSRLYSSITHSIVKTRTSTNCHVGSRSSRPNWAASRRATEYRFRSAVGAAVA